MQESRVKKSLLNARVSLIFYTLNLLISFFSRKIFLERLSADFVGLTQTLQSMLNFLNLAELGIGSAIGYLLYRPLFDKDHGAINEIISVFGYIYHIIGWIILVGGVALSTFFPLIFRNSGVSFGVIYFAFYAYLFTSLLSYFVNYKQTLLGADQRNYIVAAYTQTSGIVCYVMQMALVYYTESPYIWVAINILSSVIYMLILNWKIDQVYPWLRANVKLGRKIFKRYPEIIRYTKQLFIHKIGGFAQYQIRPIIIYTFTSLQVVAYYSNYTIITTKLTTLIGNLLGSTGAGVGNLIAEGDQERIKGVFWELLSFRIFTSGTLVYSLYHLIDPFVSLWLGAEYVMDRSVIILILAALFIDQTRGATDQFLYGYGLFRDVWAPLVETILSITISIGLGFAWGLQGVLLGSILSMIPIVSIWKPYFLYRDGFKESIWSYWFNIFKYTLLLAAMFWFNGWLITFININPYDSFLSWVLYSATITTLFIASYGALFCLISKGMRDVVGRVLRLKIINRQ